MKKLMMALAAGSMMLTHAQAQETKAPASWADTLVFKGDLRYRYESIEEEGKVDRTRNRIRARLGAEAKPSDEVTVGLRLSTAQDNDPVSSNQTLGEGFSRKDIFLDLAYLDYHPAAVKGLSLIGGKMENPFARVSDLVWDGDLNPEGLAAKYTVGSDGLDVFANAGYFWVEERSADEDDALLLGGQLGVKAKNDNFNGLLAAGYYTYDNLKGYPVIDVTASERAKAKSYGNSTEKVTETDEAGEEVVTDLLYGTGFDIAELIGEIGFDVGVPVSVYGSYAVNQDADDDDTAYLGGLRLGKTKAPGSFDFDYNYRELESNSVLGAFSDSDFIGGGTNGKGHKFALGVQLTKVLKGTVTYFMNEKGLTGDSKDYDRLQVDVAAKF